MTDSISLDCPAKLNLLLRVLAREADGYHGLETIFCRISLSDHLQVDRIDSGIELRVDGNAAVKADEDNLAWRAARLALDATNRRFGVRINLIKKIPVGAGLGGGSSDAATTLHAINQLADEALSRADLFDLAIGLGADVPFFVSRAPLALAWGHGERLLTLPALPERPMLLLVPPARVETTTAYRWLDELHDRSHRRGSIALDVDAITNWSDLARMGGNDFESVIFGRNRRIKAAFEALAGTAPTLCRMSGSGSALFAVYRTERDREDAIMTLGSRHGQVIPTVNN